MLQAKLLNVNFQLATAPRMVVLHVVNHPPWSSRTVMYCGHHDSRRYPILTDSWTGYGAGIPIRISRTRAQLCSLADENKFKRNTTGQVRNCGVVR